MIPILYEGTETSFTKNGIGRLSDAISCNVIEERNGLYELEMQYPVDGIFYDEITEGRIILALPFDGGTTQPFTIYQITKPLNQIVTVRAQHISYMLSGIVVMPFTASSCAQAIANVGTYSSTTNPFTFSTDKTTTGNYKLEVPTPARAVLAGSSGSLLGTYGKGDYEFNRFDVILRNNRGADNGVTLRYGKNITDIKSVIDMTNVYTGIVPYWTDSEGNIVTLTEKVVLSDHVDDYPYKIIKPVDFSDKFENAPTQNELRTIAQNYVANNEGWTLKNNITVSFVALWNTEEYKNIAALERVKLCDVVHIVFPKLNINVDAKVIKTDFDVLQQKYNFITLGDSFYNLSSMISDLSDEVKTAEENQKSFIQKAIDHATELITGGLGGHVVLKQNANGEPEEILIMDTDDISTANKVWRWNVNGLGYSSTGYSGQYGTAITMDGRIVADFITTGTMEANRVRAGILTDEVGNNYWNLTTGEFRLSAATTVGGSTVQTIANNAAAAAEQASATALSNFINNTYSPTVTNLASQIDGKAETWYQAADPSTSWTTTDLKEQHVGDLWYCTASGANKDTTWYYQKSGNTYGWVQQSIPEAVFDTIDGKAQIFVTQPLPPYYVGDLYCQGASGDILTCTTERLTGQYNASDWSKLNNYVDENDVDNRISYYDTYTLNQTKVFNKLTNNGALQGIFMQNGQLFINATYIATGILSDPQQHTTWNLTSGALYSDNLSIQSPNFQLTSNGDITATSATLNTATLNNAEIVSSNTVGSALNIDNEALSFKYDNNPLASIEAEYGYWDYSYRSYLNINSSGNINLSANDSWSGDVYYSGVNIGQQEMMLFTGNSGAVADFDLDYGSYTYILGDQYENLGVDWTSSSVWLTYDTVWFEAGSAVIGGVDVTNVQRFNAWGYRT